ncbi:hypothetical protein L1987_47307 [Smallanthus sonchifolius]|uniref:Uncharacterized protein n=1 Tax=Smallanthus sonchifolius TaxID=185202 RepID=A0ACB9G3Y3_9ASTR|nr:hypothetical protein L1987_47307 [Smallanthus sonchifolius]
MGHCCKKDEAGSFGPTMAAGKNKNRGFKARWGLDFTRIAGHLAISGGLRAGTGSRSLGGTSIGLFQSITRKLV